MRLNDTVFDNPDFDKARFEADLQHPMPRRHLGILFTPRSGSSWLTDILRRSRLLGKPNEWFNPNFIPDILRAVNASSLDGYLDMIQRRHALGDVFSFEVTIYQMHRVFGTEAAFLDRFPQAMPWVYLRREDMVAQAVSLAKAVSTEVFHAHGTDDARIEAADRAFSYDAAGIEKWLRHIFDQERKCEDFLARNAITPLRLNYEQNTAQGAEAVINRILPLVWPEGKKLPPRRVARLASTHRKIGSDKNAEFAARFAREHPALLDEIAAFRAGCPA